jgi:hypothetical protein
MIIIKTTLYKAINLICSIYLTINYCERFVILERGSIIIFSDENGAQMGARRGSS